MSDSWTQEILLLLLCWACLTAIGILLYCHDGKPVPHWPLDLSLNSAVSILTRVIEGSIACVVYSVMFQSLYLWNRKERQLQDLETIAKAARSVQGFFAIAKLQRFAGLASLLALVHVISQGVSTNVQQSISVQPVMSPHGVGTVSIATRVSRQLSSSSSISNLDNQMVATMWGGLLGTIGDLLEVPATCNGATECHWDNYSSIAVSYRCQDLGHLVVPCENGSALDCSHMLPTEGGALMVGADQRSTSMAYIFPDFMTDIPWYLAAWKTLGIPEDPNNQTAVAAQCKVFWTLETYSGSMINGSSEERPVADPWHNKTATAINNPELIMTTNDSAKDVFSISGATALSLQRFNLNFFTGNSTATTEGIDFGGMDQLQIQYSSLLDGSLDSRVENYAKALSRTVRIGTPVDTLYDSSVQPATQVSCQSFREEQRIQINPYWLIPPLLVILSATFIFIIVAVLTCIAKIGIHKGNVLDLLAWAPSDESRNRIHQDTGSWDLRGNRNAMFISRWQGQRDGLELVYVGEGRRPDPTVTQRIQSAFGQRRAAANGPDVSQRIETPFGRKRTASK